MRDFVVVVATDELRFKYIHQRSSAVEAGDADLVAGAHFGRFEPPLPNEWIAASDLSK
jgi:hypothetical protein